MSQNPNNQPIKDNYPKVNRIAQLEFQLAYVEVVVQQISRYTTGKFPDIPWGRQQEALVSSWTQIKQSSFLLIKMVPYSH